MKKSIVVTASIMLALALAGCSEGTDQVTSKSKAKVPSGTYQLIYMDQPQKGDAYNDDDSYVPNDNIGIVVKGKTYEFYIGANNVNEHVALKYASKPVAKIKKSDEGDTVNIYRGPYTQYVQPDASGKVESK